MKRTLTLLATAGLFSLPLAGQANVTGKWEMTSQTPRGETTQIITLQQDGNTVSGTFERGAGGGGARGGGGGRGGRGGGMGMTVEIQDGAVDGNTISFLVVRGRGDRSFEMEYSGTIDGDTITGVMSTMRGEMEFTMVRVET